MKYDRREVLTFGIAGLAGLAGIALGGQAFGEERVVDTTHPPSVRWPSSDMPLLELVAEIDRPSELIKYVRACPGATEQEILSLGRDISTKELWVYFPTVTMRLDGEPSERGYGTLFQVNYSYNRASASERDFYNEYIRAVNTTTCEQHIISGTSYAAPLVEGGMRENILFKKKVNGTEMVACLESPGSDVTESAYRIFRVANSRILPVDVEIPNSNEYDDIRKEAYVDMTRLVFEALENAAEKENSRENELFNDKVIDHEL